MYLIHLKKAKTQGEKKDSIKKFREECKDNVVTKFLEEVDWHCMGWCE